MRKRKAARKGTLVVCDVCEDGKPCPDHVGYETVQLEVSHSFGMRWDREGRCFETVNNEPEARRPDCDFGTPTGDVLIDPWIQELVGKEPA